ncbi:hypothetical protein [Streptomyces sp. WAC01526]|uniref:hypothetical protein n=1 Tax=Streptomyces sp. WAC01526 TaxID=2588709 RepID=UPI0011E0022F|nr:hypothetical protein [Streptomyces sp. WAC01526]MCW7987884.1 hypothetical protein [Streptomyces platensis subsp. clarensis]
MPGDFYIDPQELDKLAKAFESRAYDLSRAIKSFRGKTDAEQIHDGFGFLTESEEVTSAYIELSSDMTESLSKLARHLDEVSRSLDKNSRNSREADEALEEMFKGGKK